MLEQDVSNKSWETLAGVASHPIEENVYDGVGGWWGVVTYVVDVSNRRHGYVNFIAPL